MGILKAMWKSRGFKSHDHITVSGGGVISTTVDHIISTPNAKRTVDAVKELRTIVKEQDNQKDC